MRGYAPRTRLACALTANGLSARALTLVQGAILDVLMLDTT
jgi:hypothetical protein